jgi:hypothetical protein
VTTSPVMTIRPIHIRQHRRQRKDEEEEEFATPSPVEDEVST